MVSSKICSYKFVAPLMFFGGIFWVGGGGILFFGGGGGCVWSLLCDVCLI